MYFHTAFDNIDNRQQEWITVSSLHIVELTMKHDKNLTYQRRNFLLCIIILVCQKSVYFFIHLKCLNS